MLQDEEHRQCYFPDFPELFDRGVEEFKRDWGESHDGVERVMSFKRGRKEGHINLAGIVIVEGPPNPRRIGKNRVAAFLNQ